jgi:hypothetical protein
MNDIRMLTISEASKEMGVAVAKLRLIVDTEYGPRSVAWGNEKRLPGWESRRWQEAQAGAIDKKIEEMLKTTGVKTNTNRRIHHGKARQATANI